MKKLLNLISTKTKLKCIGVILLAFISSFLATTWPVKLGELYTNISDGSISTVSKGILAIATFGIIYLAAECITILRRVLLDCVIADHESDVRKTSVEKLLKMPVSYYNGGLSGERTAQLNQGVAGLSQLIKIFCNDIFATILTAICTLFQVWKNAPIIMAGIMLAYLIFTLLISIFQIRSQNGIRENIISQKNAYDGQVCQSIGNLELIRAMNAQEYEKQRLSPSINKIALTEKKHHKYMGAFDCLKQGCKIIFQVIILLTSIYLIASNKMNAGAVVTVCLLFQQLIKPIDEVYRFMDETASSIVKAKVLIEVSASGTDPVFSINSSNIYENKQHFIELNNTVITDPTMEKPLASYEKLSIPTNSVVAIRGKNGCGKTTLMRCITRFFPFVSGTVKLFDKDINMYSQKELTESIFYTPQKAFFFVGTVADNLKYGIEREVSDDEMITALKQACLFEVLVEKLRAKLNMSTISERDVLAYAIGENGSGLSGGEGQRLAIARAFLRNAKVFIFDESTANIDADTTARVLSNVEQYAKEMGSGVIYISHDENVNERCDQVIWLENKLKEENVA